MIAETRGSHSHAGPNPTDHAFHPDSQSPSGTLLPRRAHTPTDLHTNLRRERIITTNLKAGFGKAAILKGINAAIYSHSITAIMGPSGCGKSTFIRCINRLHEEVPGAWINGQIALDGHDLYHRSVDPVSMRSHIGMVFQRPNPFPTYSIFDNVAIGLRINGLCRKSELAGRVEDSLRKAALWLEVKDRLKQRATSLSGGQQQRLCIARALAVQPEILLLDEPCSALDPAATERIEDLLVELRSEVAVVMVTHNMQQARRIADRTLFFLMGELVEAGPTADLFQRPTDQRTEAFVAGRFG